MKKLGFIMGAAASATLFASSAMANDPMLDRNQSLNIEQASQYLHYSDGNDRMRVEIAPNYSEELGFSLRGAAGGYLTDAVALGLIVEYGENKREYLANAGIQFTDELSLVGTVGLLEEHNEYVGGEGREEVQQMEYGTSLKGAYKFGFISGFELNGYLADADADSRNVETGKLYGLQLKSSLNPTETTHIKLSGGYEWLTWDNANNDDSSFSFSGEATQQLGEVVSISANAKLGASEYVYGGGISFNLSNGGPNTNTIALNYSRISGRNGVEDDQRVELGWSIGFVAGPTQMASLELKDTGSSPPVADVATVAPANNLLGDVMKRPAYLPKQVLARSVGGACATISSNSMTPYVLTTSNHTVIALDRAALEATIPGIYDAKNAVFTYKVSIFVNDVPIISAYDIYENDGGNYARELQLYWNAKLFTKDDIITLIFDFRNNVNKTAVKNASECSYEISAPASLLP